MVDWLKIHGLENYAISKNGEVLSVQRTVGSSNQHGNCLATIRKRLLSPGKTNHGYLSVVLYQGGKKKTCSLHRLVAKAFIPNPDNLPQINHINGIKTDNRVENLEWCDNSHNQRHAFDNGLKKPSYGNQKLTQGQINEIRELYLLGKHSYSDLAKKYNVAKSTIARNIKKYRR